MLVTFAVWATIGLFWFVVSALKLARTIVNIADLMVGLVMNILFWPLTFLMFMASVIKHK